MASYLTQIQNCQEFQVSNWLRKINKIIFAQVNICQQWEACWHSRRQFLNLVFFQVQFFNMGPIFFQRIKSMHKDYTLKHYLKVLQEFLLNHDSSSEVYVCKIFPEWIRFSFFLFVFPHHNDLHTKQQENLPYHPCLTAWTCDEWIDSG